MRSNSTLPPGSENAQTARGAVLTCARVGARSGARLRLRGEFEVADAEDSAPGLVGEAFDLPTVREHDLLDNRQTQTSALRLRGEVRFENLRAAVGGNARAVVPHLEHGFGGIALFGGEGHRSEEHT